jgi:uncharacterized protein (TIGR02246 family)
MSVEDKLAIQEVIAQYSYTYDSQDAAGFAQLFVEDGVFETFDPARPPPRSASSRERRFATGLHNGCTRVTDDSPAVTTNLVRCLMR